MTGHAHAAEAVKLGVRSGFRVLYHCTYADEEAIGLLASSAIAQIKTPDLSGTWKLNLQRSSVETRTVQDIAPDRIYVQSIAAIKNGLTIATKTNGAANRLDGTWQISVKFKIEKVGKNYRYSRAYWEGATLVVEQGDREAKKDTIPFAIYIRESWQMSFDGKVLTQLRRTVQGKTLTDQKYVLDKQ